MVRRRQVSTRWAEVDPFLESLSQRSQLAGGYVAVIEVCGFHDWLVERLGRMIIIRWRTPRALAPRLIAVRVPRRYGWGVHGERIGSGRAGRFQPCNPARLPGRRTRT